MKYLIRRLSRVHESPDFVLLPSNPLSSMDGKESKGAKNRRVKRQSRRSFKGRVPVHVGEEMERFSVSAELLNNPVFCELLKRSAQEYGYEQEGVLRIPCPVHVFRQLLQCLEQHGDIHELQRMTSLALL
ncbi:auxin-responsive protein SAUR71 [Amborella trichopoda]|uniref:Uncharacterized protein n=1 Tax=Amborella trichopoda TaxID=13333 RepID=U5D2B0_AMBTC|nr:auxin-responsive protein SAUR71 [Amborella trichopoda]ERN14498.1 hypothetical protein AMTR_s00174p00065990 [Amborella trichopoda]|eukprot:XP_006853031.1 auxin-responsive protein SAUR71 [Amborella trichopoda]